MYIYTWFHTYRCINIRFHVKHVTWYQSDVTLYAPSPDPFQTFTYLLSQFFTSSQESDLPGAQCVLEMLQSEIAIRSFSIRKPSPKTQPNKTHKISAVLKRMSLAELVSLLCSIMSESTFPKFVSLELSKMRHTEKTLKSG